MITDITNKKYKSLLITILITNSILICQIEAVLRERHQSGTVLKGVEKQSLSRENGKEGEEEEEDWCIFNQDTKLLKLGDDCQILKNFNQTFVDSLEQNELIDLSDRCACQLASMADLWEETFDDDDLTRRVATLVDNVTRTAVNNTTGTVQLPEYLWNDADVCLNGISIYTSTKDFFEQQRHNTSMVINAKLRKRLDKDEIWTSIRSVCRKIVQDPKELYIYIENLIRLNPNAFFKLIKTSELVELIYQASKACKLLLMLRLRDYKLRRDSSDQVDFVSVAYENDRNRNGNDESENSLTNDIDSMLRDSSALLLKCNSWQSRKSSIQDLQRDCPMMMIDNFQPTEWIKKHPSKWDRTQISIKCGCQLLLHKSTWSIMMEDSNVKMMSSALTNYMNQNSAPNFDNTPIFAIHGWFQGIMSKFLKNRKMSIKEIVKTMSRSPDPLKMINKDTGEFEIALESMRKGCNYIMFNYNKGSKEAISELKLIRYLGNLQSISLDPTFVFHLTLQDPNLFKLHALSKMCQPFVF